MRPFSCCLPAGAVVVLTACGGTTSPMTNVTYRTFANTDPVTTELVGQQLGAVVSDAIRPASVSPLSGTITHDTGAMTIGGGPFVGADLSDADGPDGNGLLEDTPANTNALSRNEAVIGGQGFSGNYDYVVPASQQYIVANQFGFQLVAGGYRSEIGFLGVATDAGDIPASASVTYTGEAVGQINYIGGTFNEPSTFPATVTADYLNGDVSMTATNTVGGNTDILSLNGMTITGNTFGGGTPSLTRNGVAQDVSDTSFYQAAGNLYGYDPSASAPDEVGMITRGIGDDAYFAVTVLAD